jgi:Domain of unknown function (DUF4136)
MRYPLLSTLLGTVAFTLFGCSTQPVSIKEVQSPAFTDSSISHRSSFAFVPHLNQGAAAAVSNAGFWQKQISEAIASILTEKGYRSTPAVRKADILVAFHVVLRQGEYVTIFDNYSGYQLPAAKKASAGIAKLAAEPNGQAEIGTLVIDIIDPVTKTVVWRGWGKADISHPGDQTVPLIKKTAAEILRNFPEHS